MAHPLTHLTLGLVLAGTFAHVPYIPRTVMPYAQLLAVLGAIAPDLVMIRPFIRDVVFRRSLTIRFLEDDVSVLAYTISHSVIVWIAVSLTAVLVNSATGILALAFGTGGLSHCLIDWMTHGGRVTLTAYKPQLWPLPYRLPAFWFAVDYRVGSGVLGLMKLWEVLLCMILIYIFALL